MKTLNLLALICSLLALGCGAQNVGLLDPRDESLPAETRQWIADVEDGVIAARTRRDAAARHLAEALGRQERLTEEVRFAAVSGADPSGPLRIMLASRVSYAELGLEYAEARVELALQKQRLANAEQSLIHGIARYDLTLIEATQNTARDRVQELRTALRGQERETDERNREFWRAYEEYVRAGGETVPFWNGLGDSALVESTVIDSVSGPIQATDDELPPMLRNDD